MLSKEVKDWIASEEAKGYSSEQINYFLTQKGFDSQEIYAAINEINGPKYKDNLSKGAHRHFLLLVAILIIIIGAGIGIFLFMDGKDDSPSDNLPPGEPDIPIGGLGAKDPGIVEERFEYEEEPADSGCERFQDCGSASPMNACFIEAARNCCPAKIVSTATIDLFGVQVTSVLERELKGFEEGRCMLYETLIGSNIVYTEELKSMMIESGLSMSEIMAEEEASNTESNMMIGKNSLCKYPLTDLVTQLEAESVGDYSGSSDDVAKYQCTGSLYDDIQNQ